MNIFKRFIKNLIVTKGGYNGVSGSYRKIMHWA